MPSEHHYCALSEGVKQCYHLDRCTVVVEVAVVTVNYGGISHISRIVVVVVTVVVMVLVVV